LLYPTELRNQYLLKERATHPAFCSKKRDCSIPENLTAESGLDFRGSSKNIANRRFAVFRDQLSYGTILRVQNYIIFQMMQENTSPSSSRFAKASRDKLFKGGNQ
jgi:hypothetical protein